MDNIGLAVARSFRRAFETSMYTLDPFAPTGAWDSIPHTRVDSLDEMLPHIDVLTPYVLLAPET